MDIVNSRNELFGAIRIPLLKGTGRDQIKEFMTNYKAYVHRQEVRRNLGEKVETLRMRDLVDLDLLGTIAVYELDKTGVEELSDDEVSQYLKNCLAPSSTHFPSVKELFGNLKFSVLGANSPKKVVDFFKNVQKVVDENGLERYGEKLLTKRLLDIIQPKKLRSLILEEIEFNGKESVQTRIALFKLVKHHAINLSFYYDVGASG